MEKEDRKEFLTEQILKLIAQKGKDMRVVDVISVLSKVGNHLQGGLVIGREVFPQGR